MTIYYIYVVLHKICSMLLTLGYKTGQEGNSSRMTGCEKAEYDEWNVIPPPSREHS